MNIRSGMDLSKKLLLAFLLLFSAACLTQIAALELTGRINNPNPSADSKTYSEFELVIRSRSGTPLILEFLLNDPKLALKQFTLETQVGDAHFDLPGKESSETFLSPFYEPGVYPVVLTLGSGEDTWKRELLVGFTEFIWGRDNFRFSNIRNDYSGIRPYSKVLFPWAEKRFGSLQQEDLMVLLDIAYHILNGRFGRCYAFTGSQVRYARNPELLPSYYKTVYAVRETNTSVQAEMNMLQNDIVYDHFAIKGYDFNIPQELSVLQAEITTIVEKISSGELVSIGYVSAERHHSLLVYGFISDPASSQITLITANNWGVEHNENMVSKAVVLIDINLDETYTKERVHWVDAKYSVYDFAEHLFSVDVQDAYEHDYAALSTLIAEQHEQLSTTETALVIVEQARNAVLSDAEGNGTGRLNLSTLQDLDGVEYRRIEDAHLFELPVGQNVELQFTPLNLEADEETFRTDCNVFVLAYPVVDGIQRTYSAVYTGSDFAAGGNFVLQITPNGLDLKNETPKEENSVEGE
ncbi:MAG: hypothetical protein KAQ69_00280 [Spirochaetales bacterium]|nr:hypothetical protein [Spirochaetales bacterium]